MKSVAKPLFLVAAFGSPAVFARKSGKGQKRKLDVVVDQAARNESFCSAHGCTRLPRGQKNPVYFTRHVEVKNYDRKQGRKGTVRVGPVDRAVYFAAANQRASGNPTCNGTFCKHHMKQLEKEEAARRDFFFEDSPRPRKRARCGPACSKASSSSSGSSSSGDEITEGANGVSRKANTVAVDLNRVDLIRPSAELKESSFLGPQMFAPLETKAWGTAAGKALKAKINAGYVKLASVGEFDAFDLEKNEETNRHRRVNRADFNKEKQDEAIASLWSRSFDPETESKKTVVASGPGGGSLFTDCVAALDAHPVGHSIIRDNELIRAHMHSKSAKEQEEWLKNQQDWRMPTDSDHEYVVKFHESNGSRTPEIIDDKVLYDTEGSSQPYYAHANSETYDLFVPLLEKAYAQRHRGYAAIQDAQKCDTKMAITSLVGPRLVRKLQITKDLKVYVRGSRLRKNVDFLWNDVLASQLKRTFGNAAAGADGNSLILAVTGGKKAEAFGVARVHTKRNGAEEPRWVLVQHRLGASHVEDLFADEPDCVNDQSKSAGKWIRYDAFLRKFSRNGASIVVANL